MLHDLGQDGGVEPGQPRVAVGQCGLDQFEPLDDPVDDPVGASVEPQPAAGRRQRLERHVRADDPGEDGFVEERGEQRALAAAEIEHRPGPGRPEDVDDGVDPLPGQRGPAGGSGARRGRRVVRCVGDGGVRDGVVERVDLGVVGVGEPLEGERLQRAADERVLAAQVAAGDERVVGVVGEPAGPGADQFVDLVGGDPVVLGVVQDR